MYDKALEDRFNGITLETIERWVEEQASEDLYLEFKREPKDDPSLKKTFSRLISAFGNGAGGVCVWGIDAGNDGDGIDRIRALKPLASPAHFAGRLADLGMGVTAPGHAGIQHKVLAREDGSGFVVTLVPSFDGQPLMSLAGHVYLVRTCKGVAPMEHFQVADMFGRRARPYFFAELIFIGADDDYGGCVGITLAVRNRGRAMAEDVAVALRPNSSWTVIHSFNQHMASECFFDESETRYSYWAPTTRSRCHVGERLQICDLRGPKPDSISDLELDLIIMSRDMPPQKLRLHRARQELLDAIRLNPTS